MHLLDNFSVPVPSLKELCAVQVNTQLLVASRAPVSVTVIDSLDLPHFLNATLKALMKLMNKQYSFYYKQVYCYCSPIFAADGTLDLKKSVWLLLQNETLDVRMRFMVAATYCHEDYIFEHCPNISKLIADRFWVESFRLTNEWETCGWLCWLCYIIVQARRRGTEDTDVIEQLYALGIHGALVNTNDHALRFFISKASSRTVTDIFRDFRQLGDFQKFGERFTVTTLCTLFSKLDNKEKEESKDLFRVCLVKCLIFRDFSWLFEETAGTLVDDLSAQEYCKILERPLYHAVMFKRGKQERVVRMLLRLRAAKRPALEESEHFKKLRNRIQNLLNF